MGMLDGRVAICTGAARGVGAEVAKLMAAEGAKIVVVDPGVGGAGEGGDQRPAQVTVGVTLLSPTEGTVHGPWYVPMEGVLRMELMAVCAAAPAA